MKTQYKKPREGMRGGMRVARPHRSPNGAAELDTYKQFAQPNIHAGYSPI